MDPTLNALVLKVQLTLFKAMVDGTTSEAKSVAVNVYVVLLEHLSIDLCFYIVIVIVAH